MAIARNLIYFHVHDLGRHIPVYGAPTDAPNLARFAGQSVTFENTFCSAAACTPSRACALSGCHAHTTGCIGLAHMGWPLDLEQRTIVDDVNDAGFESALSGVCHERHPRTDRYTVDMNRTFDDTQTAQAVDNALTFLESRDRSKRLFLNVGSQQPHASTWHRFDPDPSHDVWLPLWCPDSDDRRAQFGRFQAAIRYMDEHFGRFIEGLDRLGYADDTAVVFTTDHGIAAPGAKSRLYDRGLEIALIIRLPGEQLAGQRRTQLIGNIDYRPTWCDLIGIAPPAGVDGKSFFPALADSRWSGNDHVFSERNFHGEKVPPEAEEYTDLYDPMRTVRTRDFRLVRYFDAAMRPLDPGPLDSGAPRPRPEIQLFDLLHDPLELIDVAGRPEYAPVRRQLEADLANWMHQTGDFLPGPPPARPDVPGWGPNWPAAD